MGSDSERKLLYSELKKFGIETDELDKLSENSLKLLMNAVKTAYAEYEKTKRY